MTVALPRLQDDFTLISRQRPPPIPACRPSRRFRFFAPADQAVAETKRIRQIGITGDFYPLTPVTASDNVTAAYQFHRDHQGDGFAYIFRQSLGVRGPRKGCFASIDRRTESSLHCQTLKVDSNHNIIQAVHAFCKHTSTLLSQYASATYKPRPCISEAPHPTPSHTHAVCITPGRSLAPTNSSLHFQGVAPTTKYALRFFRNFSLERTATFTGAEMRSGGVLLSLPSPARAA